MNFLPNPKPSEDYGTCTVTLIDQENQKIDLIMYRVTDARIYDALIRAVARGVPVRLLAEPLEYRFDASRTGSELTGPYNVDRLYAAGVQIKMRKHLGLTHQNRYSFTDRLPDGLAAGTCTVRIKAHGQMSNAGTLRIKL